MEKPTETLDILLINLFQGKTGTGARFDLHSSSPYLSEQTHDDGRWKKNYAWDELQLDSMLEAIAHITGYETNLLHRLLNVGAVEGTEYLIGAIKELNILDKEKGDSVLELFDDFCVPVIFTERLGGDQQYFLVAGTSSSHGLSRLPNNGYYNDATFVKFTENFRIFYEKAGKIADLLEHTNSSLLNDITYLLKDCLENKRVKEAYESINKLGVERKIDKKTITFRTALCSRKISGPEVRSEVEIEGYSIIMQAKDTEGNPIEKEVGFIDGRTAEEYGYGVQVNYRVKNTSIVGILPSSIIPDHASIMGVLLDGFKEHGITPIADYPHKNQDEKQRAIDYAECKKIMDKTHTAIGLLAHIMSSVKYRQELEKQGLPYCLGSENPDGIFELKNAHPPVLAAKKIKDGKEVVGNDCEFNGKSIAVLAGANGAGKTTYLITMGQNKLLAEVGWLNCASSVSYPHGGKVYTLFADRQQKIEGGKSRHIAHGHDVRYILERAQKGDLLLFDEFFTGTEESAGAELGVRAIDYIKDRIGAYACIATHNHPIQGHYQDDKKIRNLMAVISRDNGTITPTFRIAEGIAGKSYGVEMMDTILNMDEITERRMSLQK